MSTVRIPADIDQDDKLLAGLTARQVVLVAVPAIALWTIYMTTRRVIPLVVFAPFAAVVAGTVGTFAVAKRDGISLDRFALGALKHLRNHKRYVTAPTDAILPNGIAALHLPIQAVRADGIVYLGAFGVALICGARATNLNLQSEAEQIAITDAFGRFCNGIGESVQFLIRTEPISLGATARELAAAAPALPSVGLEAAALDHARFLDGLAGRHDLMHRQVFVVFHEQHETGLLARRVEDATSQLRAAGVEITPLNQQGAIDAIQRATSPIGPRRPLEDFEITGASITGANITGARS